ncbi:acyltransferase family protein [Ensifer sp. 2YAB10]|uniref:acyltransferase family protein n=1 Tax=unclassified Ensifer TaxID=2633371 RepID=UPI003F92341F
MHYNPALDGLRAVAVFTVVAFHCRFPFALGGMVGVDVFFVLSGYLITTILRSGIGLPEFYWRRATRLYPPLLLMLAAYAASAPLVFPTANPAFDVLLAGLYLSDSTMAFWYQPLSIGHTWSLAVEEHFYLVWPLIILATRPLPVRPLMWLLAVGFVVATTWRIVDAHVWQDWHRTYFRFDTRMSGLILGALIAVMPWRPRGERVRFIGRISIYMLLVALLFFRFRNIWFIGWGGIAVDLAAAGLVLSLVSGETAISRFLARDGLRYLGLLSYSIYLWHYPIALALRDQLDPFTTSIVVGGLATLIAAVSYRYIEKPLKDLRDRRRAA